MASIQAFFDSASVRVEPSGPVTASRPSSPPLTKRSPSHAVVRMPPPGCASTLWVPPSFARTTAPSPSPKAAVVPIQAVPVTCAPSASGSTASVREGAVAEVMTIHDQARGCGGPERFRRRRPVASSHDAGLEALADSLLVEVAADEHHPGLALLGR